MLDILLNLYHFCAQENLFIFQTNLLLSKYYGTSIFIFYGLPFFVILLLFLIFDLISYFLGLFFGKILLKNKKLIENKNIFYIYGKFIPFFSSITVLIGAFFSNEKNFKKDFKKLFIGNVFLMFISFSIILIRVYFEYPKDTFSMIKDIFIYILNFIKESNFLFLQTNFLFINTQPFKELFYTGYSLVFLFFLFFLHDLISYFLGLFFGKILLKEKKLIENKNIFYIYGKFIPFFSSFTVFFGAFFSNEKNFKKDFKKIFIGNVFLMFIFAIFYVFYLRLIL